jgi:hypothetical protein
VVVPAHGELQLVAPVDVTGRDLLQLIQQQAYAAAAGPSSVPRRWTRSCCSSSSSSSSSRLQSSRRGVVKTLLKMMSQRVTPVMKSMSLHPRSSDARCSDTQQP